MAALRPLLPARHAPLQSDGRGMQSVYLTELAPRLMNQLALLIGEPALQMIDTPPLIARDSASALEAIANPVQERWEQQIVRDISSLNDVPETQRQQLIYARVGQGKFRSLIYARERACRVTRVDRPEHLVASHIRPWRHSSNPQRLDPENGLMLTPNVDHLFDRGFITFSTAGQLVYSPSVDHASMLRMGLDPAQRIEVGAFSTEQKRHLEFHRDEVFLGTRDASIG
jgi:putative restriction endonuclease